MWPLTLMSYTITVSVYIHTACGLESGCKCTVWVENEYKHSVKNGFFRGHYEAVT